jgi:hypothetical protein
MLNKAKTLTSYKLDCVDGEIGKVKDFYFDDQHWAIRYLVADTGDWLTGRLVLISPYALVTVLREERDIVTDLTKKQIENSPPADTHQPVSRQFEADYYQYYGWPAYWDGPFMWGPYPYPMRDLLEPETHVEDRKTGDLHLRSTHDIGGYHIQAADGEIGHVDDFVIDDETWAIRYLIVGTRNWLPGKKVLVSPQWIERVSWSESKVFVKLSREAVKQAPEYTEDSIITRDYETELHGHYNRRGYWVDEAAARAKSSKG